MPLYERLSTVYTTRKEYMVDVILRGAQHLCDVQYYLASLRMKSRVQTDFETAAEPTMTATVLVEHRRRH